MLMRCSWAFLSALFLVACDPHASEQPAEQAAGLPGKEPVRLLPGLYEVTGSETLPGIGTRMIDSDRQCFGPDDAAHPDRLLVNPGSGCQPGELFSSDGEFRREFRCNDNRVINFTVRFTNDSWEQSLIGTSNDGGYESLTSGKRVGDC
jgi:hypothetical protein